VRIVGSSCAPASTVRALTPGRRRAIPVGDAPRKAADPGAAPAAADPGAAAAPAARSGLMGRTLADLGISDDDAGPGTSGAGTAGPGAPPGPASIYKPVMATIERPGSAGPGARPGTAPASLAAAPAAAAGAPAAAAAPAPAPAAPGGQAVAAAAAAPAPAAAAAPVSIATAAPGAVPGSPGGALATPSSLVELAALRAEAETHKLAAAKLQAALDAAQARWGAGTRAGRGGGARQLGGRAWGW